MARTGPFDRHAREYEAWFSRNTFVYHSELKAVAHFLPPVGEGLEIGVGSGKFAQPLGVKYGVEPSARMRTLAESRAIRVFDGVAENLPFPDGRFDYVLMVTTICFVDDAAKSIQEAARVLKAEGVFVIGFVDKDSPLGRLYQRRKEHNLFYREATFYSASELIGLLQQCGFEQPQTIQTVFGQMEKIRSVQDFENGHGRGGFVVIRARKELARRRARETAI
jgi:SAM-dependent methyltransferase